MHFPSEIERLTAGKAYRADSVGLSDSAVLLFSDQVLKIQADDPEAANELAMMRWLDGRLPVPRVLAHAQEDGRSYLLQSRLPGEMACAERYMRDPQTQTRLLADGLRMLWQVDIATCPCDCGLDRKLEQAARNVADGLVDVDNVEPDTFGSDGFENPAALLRWLWAHRPEEEPALSHGDYCLPNVFLDGGNVSGFLDLGRAGVADKWCDIALCYRSLSHNYSGRFHSAAYSGYDDLLLFKALGLEPDWQKIRYYILLDELF